MPDMNHQRWIKPLLITLLLCCAAPLSVAGDEPTATSQEQAQKATEQTAQTAEPFTIAVLPDTQYLLRLPAQAICQVGQWRLTALLL